MNKIYFAMLEILEGERGASGVEYGVLVAAIAAVIVTVAFLLGGRVVDAFQVILNALP